MMQYVSVGFTKKTHGTKGELKVAIEERKMEDFCNADLLFLRLEGKEVPFFIEGIRFANTPLVKLEDVDSREAALELTSKEIFLRSEDLLPETDRRMDLGRLKYEKYEGFRLVDDKKGAIGIIEKVVEYPQQEMAVVRYQGKKILVPLNDQLVVEIKTKEKKLIVELPEGLLELFQ